MTTWFPTEENPAFTPFIPRHVEAIGRDHEVHVVHVRLLNSEPVRSATVGGFLVSRVGCDPRHPLSLVRTVREIRRWARSADLVHTMAFSSTLVAAAAVRGTPWVHTEHWNGVVHPDTVGPLWERTAWLRHVLRLPTLVTGVSSLVNRVLQDFARPGRVRPLGNVVEFAGEPQEKGRSADEVALVGVGSLIPRKGPVLAVETVAWLREHGVRASLVWDGTGPLLEEARARALALGVERHVVFNGHREPDEVRDDLAAADLFLLPTLSETFCVAAAEALAAGRPVVMGARGGQRDFITTANGRLVEEQSPEAYGRAVMEVLSGEGIGSPDELADGIRARYGPETVADQVSALYEEAVRLHGGRRTS